MEKIYWKNPFIVFLYLMQYSCFVKGQNLSLEQIDSTAICGKYLENSTENEFGQLSKIYPLLIFKLDILIKNRDDFDIKINKGELYAAYVLMACVKAVRKKNSLKKTFPKLAETITKAMKIQDLNFCYLTHCFIEFSTTDKEMIEAINNIGEDNEEKELKGTYYSSCLSSHLKFCICSEKYPTFPLQGTRQEMEITYKALYPLFTIELFEPWLNELLDMTHSQTHIILPMTVIACCCIISFWVLKKHWVLRNSKSFVYKKS